MFEDRKQRKMLESKRDDMTKEWRKLHNEELHKLYYKTKYF
jgi:hypothetical protein